MMHKRVRITITDGMGRVRVLEDDVNPSERTASVAAHDLVDSFVLSDGDTIQVDFLEPAYPHDFRDGRPRGHLDEQQRRIQDLRSNDE